MRGHEERSKVVKFLIVGGTNTALMYGLYLLLLWVGVAYVPAVIADYAIGIAVGYLLNRHWTFASQGRPTYGFLKYCTSYVGVFLLNLVLLVGFVELGDIDEGIAQIPAIGLATVASYLLQRRWVFRAA